MNNFPFTPETHVLPNNPTCPVCSTPAEIYLRKRDKVFEGRCEICGNVLIQLKAVERLGQLGKRHILSRWLTMHQPNPGELDARDVEAIIAAEPEYSASEKLDITLALIEKMTPHPGAPSQFSINKHYPLIRAQNWQEAQFYVLQLDRSGHVDYTKPPSPTASMTASGYNRLREIQASGKQSSIAFVAMWFDPQTSSVYDEVLKPAIIDAGYKPIRMLELEHVNRIDDEIIAQMRGARFMVADFTGQRAGVYFEAGYMMGQGRRVFWTCKQSDLKEIHFDNRSYNFILTDDHDDARKRLRARIVALEGEGPEVVPKA